MLKPVAKTYRKYLLTALLACAVALPGHAGFGSVLTLLFIDFK